MTDKPSSRASDGASAWTPPTRSKALGEDQAALGGHSVPSKLGPIGGTFSAEIRPRAALPEVPVVDEAELAAWEAALVDEFKAKDANGDGMLSMKELPLKELLRLDIDHNGRISFDEYRACFLVDSELGYQRLNQGHGLTIDQYRGLILGERARKR